MRANLTIKRGTIYRKKLSIISYQHTYNAVKQAFTKKRMLPSLF